MKRKMTEQENREYERQQMALRGTRQGKKWFQSLGLALPFVILTICLVAIASTMIYRSNMLFVSQDATAQAKDVLRSAAGAADSYASNNGGSYASMSAADLRKTATEFVWLDGTPGEGQLGITEISVATYTIIYMNTEGVRFSLVRDDQGVVSYLTANGESL